MAEQSELNGRDKGLRRFIIFLGLMMLLVSQLLNFSKPVNYEAVFPPFSWLGLLGLVLMVVGWQTRPGRFWGRLALRFTLSERFFWVLAAASLAGVATVAEAFFGKFSLINYIPVLILWLLGALCYLYAFGRDSLSLRDWMPKIKAHRNEILSVLAVTLLAFALRFYELGSLPRVIDGDEGLIGLAAQTTHTGELSNPFALLENMGALYLQAINLAFRLFGVSTFALRFWPAVGGVLAIPSLYLFARQVGGKRVAFVAMFLVAASHTHIHFSRIASVSYIQGTWLVPLELYFLLSGLQKRASWRTAVGGILLAIHFSVYLTAQVMIGMLLVYMLVALVFLRPWFKTIYRQMLVFWGGFLVIFLPQAYFILHKPTLFLDRLSQDGTFQSGWLATTMQNTGQGVVEILFGRVTHAFMSLIYYPAMDFYGSPNPPLSIIAATLFLLGMTISLWRTRDPGYLLLNGYFWGATLSVGLFAIPPSADSYRMLIAIMPAFVMASLGWEYLLEMLGVGSKDRRAAYLVSTSAILASLFVFNVWTYYGDFAGQCRFTSSSVDRFASYLGSHVNAIDSKLPVYLLRDNVYFYGSHSSTDFLSNKRPITNFADPIEALSPVSGETIIASPNRIPELEAWVRGHAGGEVDYVYDCQTLILMSYQVP